jgi:hypothetical protein
VDGRATPVTYSIQVFQEVLDPGTTYEKPGLKSAAGQLSDLKPADAAKAIGHKLQLALENGQRSEVTVVNASGAFQVVGPLNSL